MRFLVEAVAFGIALAIASSAFGRKRLLPFWFFFVGFVLTDAACRVLLKHYPESSTGWKHDAVVAGISLGRLPAGPFTDGVRGEKRTET